jgi:hypothetical protein
VQNEIEIIDFLAAAPSGTDFGSSSERAEEEEWKGKQSFV